MNRQMLYCRLLSGLISLGLLLTLSPPAQAADYSTQVGLIEILTDAGWPSATAKKVVELNTDFWLYALADNPNEIQAQMNWLVGLGKHPEVMTDLRRHPELSALLARAEDPKAVIKSLQDSSCYGPVSGLLYGARSDDSFTIARVVSRHQTLLCDVARRRPVLLPAVFTLFELPETGVGVAEYERWLDDVLRWALRQGDDVLEARLALIGGSQEGQSFGIGTEIRHRMATDPKFRRQFPNQLWPAFERVVANLSANESNGQSMESFFEVLGTHPQVWDLLAMPSGEKLLKLSGLEAIDILVGPEAIPPSLHSMVTDAMLRDDKLTINAFFVFGNEPVFVQLMQKNMPLGTRRALLYRLLEKDCPSYPEKACPNLSTRLAYYRSLSDITLAEEVGPEPSGPVTWIPLYTSSQVIKKLAQGRDVSWVDVGILVVEVVTLPATLTGGGQLINRSLGGAAKAAAKQGGKVATKEAAKEAAKSGWLKIIQSAPRQSANWLVKRSRTVRYVRDQYAKLRHGWKQVTDRVENALAVDMKPALEWMFRNGGTRGKKLAEKLAGSARFYMRKDARVVVNPFGLGQTGPIAAFLKETSENALIDEVGDAALKNISAWYLTQATGSVRP